MRIARRATIPFALLAALASGCGSSGGKGSTTAAAPSPSSLAPIHGRYAPSIRASDFVTTIDNRWFPLKPGTAFHFEGVKGRTAQTDDEVVTHQTKRILGIACTVVRDTVSEHGLPTER